MELKYQLFKYIFAVLTLLFAVILITHAIDNNAFSKFIALKSDVYNPIFGIGMFITFCGFGYCWAVDLRLRGK